MLTVKATFSLSTQALSPAHLRKLNSSGSKSYVVKTYTATIYAHVFNARRYCKVPFTLTRFCPSLRPMVVPLVDCVETTKYIVRVFSSSDSAIILLLFSHTVNLTPNRGSNNGGVENSRFSNNDWLYVGKNTKLDLAIAWSTNKSYMIYWTHVIKGNFDNLYSP